MTTPSRGKTFLLVVIVVALLGHIPLLERAIRIAPNAFGNDKISRHEKRFDPVHTEVAGIGRVGYVTNLPADSISTDPIAVEHFYIAQYALAPTVLVLDTDTGLVIGDFSGNGVPSRLSGLKVEKTLGDGLFLFRGKNQ